MNLRLKHIVLIAIYLGYARNSFSFSDSLKIYRFTFSAGAVGFIPKKQSYILDHSAAFADDFNCSLKIAPDFSVSYLFKCDMEFRIDKKGRFKLLGGVGYQRFIDKNTQVGFYGGGITGLYFYGSIEEINKYHYVAPSLGIGFSKPDSRHRLWELSAAGNYNVCVARDVIHNESSNGPSRSSSYHWHKALDMSSNSFSILFSGGLYFKLKNFFVGPNVSYSAYLVNNHRVDANLPFANVFNVTRYHVISVGLNVKI